MKFRKKPVIVDAIQYARGYERWSAIVLFMGEGADFNLVPGGGLQIRTLEGDMIADIGDWLIKGVKGEIYPCKPDIFEMTYEPAPDAEKGEK